MNFRKSNLEVQVLRDCGVIHRFKFQIFGGSGRGGEFLFESISDIGGIFLILVRMDEGGVNGHGESAKALIVGIVPVVDLSLVGDLIILILVLSGHGGGDGIPCTDGVKVASNEGRPLLVVGALGHGDAADKGGGGVGHF